MRKPHVNLIVCVLLVTASLCWANLSHVRASIAQEDSKGPIRVGERLTYNISLGRFPNVAYAETYVVSRGKIAGKDAIEIQSKLKTLNFITADYLFADMQRTVFASPLDGSPIYSKTVDNSTGASIETAVNFNDKGAGVFDLSTIVYKIRNSGGTGALQLFENDRQYSVSFHTIGTEIVKCDAGEFPANIIEVQSQFLTEIGISNLKISISSDESAIPVLFRAKTTKGEFRALIASIQVILPEPIATPTPVAVQTPRPTPKPTPNEEPYIENRPLIGMPFDLGESLDYLVSSGGRPIGTVILSAKERKLINGKDSLVLSAVVKNVASAEVFNAGNGIRSNVDPVTLSPYDLEIHFDGPLAGFNQSALFDGSLSKVTVAGSAAIDVPVGTHNILSLIYAMRQFNLGPSRDSTNPINDTRVAVFWQGKANVFTMRSSLPQTITLGEQKMIMTQQVTVSTGNPQLDALGLKVWLSNDVRRIPVRFTIGTYQFDLVITNIRFP